VLASPLYRASITLGNDGQKAAFTELEEGDEVAGSGFGYAVAGVAR
jgi:hypothetical protein